MHKWGFKQKVPQKVHVNTASKQEKERFKKEPELYGYSKKKMDLLWYLLMNHSSSYDSLVRKVWIRKDERPVVRITGSHKESVLFGATSLEGKQHYLDSMIGSIKYIFRLSKTDT